MSEKTSLLLRQVANEIADDSGGYVRHIGHCDCKEINYASLTDLLLSRQNQLISLGTKKKLDSFA